MTPAAWLPADTPEGNDQEQQLGEWLRDSKGNPRPRIHKVSTCVGAHRSPAHVGARTYVHKGSRMS